jgi:two-component sensor histidine kinase
VREGTPQTLTADDLLVTHQLYQRPARPADLSTELDAYRELSSMMATDPMLAIRRFLDLALELCPAAGSAGLSELAEDSTGEQTFEWTALSGAFAPFEGGSTPRHFSPCGLCLDNHHTILVDRPGRAFAYLNDAGPEIVEGLIVPLYDTGKRPLGTLWVVSHESDARFDPTDARIMEQLAVQLVLAIKLRRKATLMVRLEESARDNQVLVEEVRHRVKNMIQMTSGLLQLQERGVRSSEAKVALQEAQSRLLVLAGVYESLLEPDVDRRHVDVATLIDRLVRALRGSSARAPKVTVRTDCVKLLIRVSSGVPVGLIVNEAVTNALKYAYDEDQSGEVLVKLECAGSKGTLTISDQGRGFTEAPRSGSLGMALMRRLARQLRGEIAVEGSKGTSVRLEWPLAADEKVAAVSETVP